ncbi:hypothetical protein [Paenarthrobacter nitroguajacolicus]|uniref:hypothetical protein n=1 Tax=Paenarthrobacter nitroguajacolicus TaxID=211146 RepID=UPI00248B1282|nr:hypothetical protein [Paenarthrobacter nitroguajacolicus]MDI2033001.1 hypothetical protein [Paenarthrobacter nitroguajacolicus]
MAVSIRASAAFVANNSRGSVSINWPAGTVAGDLAVAEIDWANPSPPGPGWLTVAPNIFAKVVTAADLSAGSFQVKTSLYGMVVFAGAARAGRVTWQNGVRVSAGGAAVFFGWSDPYDNVSEMGAPAGQVGAPAKDFTNRWSSIAARAGLTAGYVQSTASPPHSLSVEIIAAATPPAPLLSAPAAGEEVGRANPITLVWSHQGQGTQEGYRVSIRQVGASVWSYLTSAGALSASLQTVAGSQQSATITAATLTAGVAYEWQVATQENGTFSAYSEARQFIPQNPPSVTSVTPSVTAGQLAGTLSWAATATAGSLVAWQVAITTASQSSPDSPMFLSPVTAGASTTTGVPVLTWTNGASYKAWVRVQQAGGLWSPWNSGTFTVSWTPPAAPTSVAGANTRPMRANVTGVPAGRDVAAQWSRDGGATWTDLGYKIAPGTTAFFDHPLAPFNVPVIFRARSLEIVNGVGLPSAWTVSAAVVSTDRGAYFVADDGPWVAVTVAQVGPVEHVQGVQVSYGMGADGARVDRSPVQGKRGSLTLDVGTREASTALTDWITTREAWTFRGHPETGDNATDRDTGTQRMSPAKSVTSELPVQALIEDRHISFDWVER